MRRIVPKNGGNVFVNVNVTKTETVRGFGFVKNSDFELLFLNLRTKKN